MSDQPFDCVVLGAGRRGLLAGLSHMRQATDNLAVIAAAPQPGGDDRSQRSNGYTCELGAFAFTAAELADLTAPLERTPQTMNAAPESLTGSVWTGSHLLPSTVEPLPISFATGVEELWQAYRRELGSRLRLGRAATAVRRARDGWQIDLGGEAPHTIETHELVLATPLATAAQLLGGLDPALGSVGRQLQSEAHAMVFLGDHQAAGAAVLGYGIVAAPEVATPLLEVIHCSRVFAQRALPGRCLLRCELADPATATASETELGALAVRELGRWVGQPMQFGFVKAHRFATVVRDGAFAECRSRLRDLPLRVDNLRVP